MFHIFAKRFHFGTPHLFDFQVAAWWLARLYACFREVAPLALPVEVFARPPRLVKPRHGWLGLAWYGIVSLGARGRCFHNEVR